MRTQSGSRGSKDTIRQGVSGCIFNIAPAPASCTGRSSACSHAVKVTNLSKVEGQPACFGAGCGKAHAGMQFVQLQVPSTTPD